MGRSHEEDQVVALPDSYVKLTIVDLFGPIAAQRLTRWDSLLGRIKAMREGRIPRPDFGAPVEDPNSPAGALVETLCSQGWPQDVAESLTKWEATFAILSRASLLERGSWAGEE